MGQLPEKDFFPDAPNDELREAPETNERVDGFMARNAELFQLNALAWQEVEAAQKDLTLEVLGKGIHELSAFLGQPNPKSKDNPNFVKSLIRECRADAYNSCRESLWPEIDLEAENEDNIAVATSIIGEAEGQWEEEIREHQQKHICVHAGTDPAEHQPFQLVKRLRSCYTAAYFLDELGWRRITTAFEDPELSSSLLEQLYLQSEFAPNAAPGFLELVATRTQREVELKRPHVTLQTAFEKATSPYDYAEAFLLHILEQSPTLRKQLYSREVVGMLAMLELTLDNLPEELQHSHLATLLKSPTTDWPEKLPELDNALHRYSRSQTLRAYQEMLSQLKPFMQRGRIPVPQQGRKQTQPPKPTKRRDESLRTIVRSALRRPAPSYEQLEDVAHSVEIEQQPIRNFALLKKMTTHTLTFSEVDGIDGLMDSPVVSKFLQAHPDEESMPEVVRAALEFLAQQSTDPISTTTIAQAAYMIAGQRRQLRRFSFRTWPDCPVNKGVNASHTRLSYLVFTVGDERYLGIKDIVGKSRVEKGY